MSLSIIVIVVIFAHFLGDFVLQTDYLAVNKGNNLYIMFAHAFMWTFCICAALLVVGINIHLTGFIWLLLSHIVIDRWKCKLGHNNKTFAIDQILHAITIILAVQNA